MTVEELAGLKSPLTRFLYIRRAGVPARRSLTPLAIYKYGDRLRPSYISGPYSQQWKRRGAVSSRTLFAVARRDFRPNRRALSCRCFARSRRRFFEIFSSKFRLFRARMGIISPPFQPWKTFANPSRRNHIFEKIRSVLSWQTRL